MWGLTGMTAVVWRLCFTVVIFGAVASGCLPSAEERYEKHMAMATEQIRIGNLPGAVLSLQSALAARPSDKAARKQLVVCYIERGVPEQARELLGHLIAEYADDPELRLMDARIALLEADPDHALEILSAYMAAYGETASALVLVGDGHAQKHLWTEALDAYERALRQDSVAAQAWLGKARVLASLRRRDEAIAAAHAASEADPHLGAAWILQGELAATLQNHADAKVAFQVALDADPRVEFQARIGLTQALLVLGQTKEAMAQAEAMVDGYQSRPEGYFLRGVGQYMSGHYDDAVSDLQTCLSKAPRHIGAQYYLVLCQYQRQQWQQALGAASALQAQVPGIELVEMLLAELLFRTGDYEGAAKQARRVLSAKPDVAVMYRVLGLALTAGGDADEGAKALEKAQQLAPSERLELTLGNIYLSMGKGDSAIAAFDAAARSEELADDANQRLFYVRLQQGDLEGALGLVDRLLQDRPDDPTLLNRRAIALVQSGDLTGAEASFRRLIAIAPDRPSPHLNLAALWLQAGREEEARKEIESLLAIYPEHPIAHRTLATLDVEAGRPSEAIAHLRRSFAARADGHVAAELARLLLDAGAASDAREMARKATDLMPKLGAAWRIAGDAALVIGNLKSAEADLRKAAELTPGDHLVWYDLAGLEASRKNWPAAQQHIARALDLVPDDIQCTIRLIKISLAQGSTEEAAQRARKLLSRYPDEFQAYSLAVAVARLRGDETGARQTLREARTRFGEDPRVLLLQAEEALRSGEQDEAQRLYAWILERNPRAADVALRKAMLHERVGEIDEAIVSYESVLALDPQQPVALNNLAFLYTEFKDNSAKALDLLADVDAKMLIAVPLFRDTLGWSQLKSGAAKKAVSTLTQVAADLPEAGTVRYHLGAALLDAGDVANAVVHLEAALEMGLSSREEKAARRLLEKASGG
jgi:putative PEP-CTERM system TPR-repeat lipoprotein